MWILIHYIGIKILSSFHAAFIATIPPVPEEYTPPGERGSGGGGGDVEDPPSEGKI